MRATKKHMRLVVALAALVLGVGVGIDTADASVGYCPSENPHYSSFGPDVTTQTGDTLEVCFATAEFRVGLFLTPSQTGFTTSGDDTYVHLAGGACYYYTYLVSNCVSDPSFRVESASSAWSGSDVGAASSASVGPCARADVGYTLLTAWPFMLTNDPVWIGAVCVYPGGGASANVSTSGAATVHVVPGICLVVGASYTCWHVHSWTAVDGRGPVPTYHQIAGVCDTASCPVFHQVRLP